MPQIRSCRPRTRPCSTSTRTRWSVSLAITALYRAVLISQCAARMVSSATTPNSSDWVLAIAVRPTIAPIATAAAKSIAVHWASVRR